MKITDTQADLLRLGLDHLLANPDHVLESDFHRTIWVLAQMATQAIAGPGHLGTWDDMQAASDLAVEVQPPAEYLPLVEAAGMFGIPIPSLRYHVRKGHIKAYKPDKRTWMVDAHDLSVWVSERSP